MILSEDAARIMHVLQSTPFAVPPNSPPAVIAAMNDARAQLLAAPVSAVGTHLAPHAAPSAAQAAAHSLSTTEPSQPNAVQRLRIRQAMRKM